jgi:hypothetical protein
MPAAAFGIGMSRSLPRGSGGSERVKTSLAFSISTIIQTYQKGKIIIVGMT